LKLWKKFVLVVWWNMAFSWLHSYFALLLVVLFFHHDSAVSLQGCISYSQACAERERCELGRQI
jgi:hypothetical protein